MKKLTIIFFIAILTGSYATRQVQPSLVITNDVLNPVNEHLLTMSNALFFGWRKNIY